MRINRVRRKDEGVRRKLLSSGMRKQKQMAQYIMLISLLPTPSSFLEKVSKANLNHIYIIKKNVRVNNTTTI